MIVLASASPRRRDLLTSAGFAFRVEVSHVDEEAVAIEDPVAQASELARRKACAVVERLRARRAATDTWVVGADTVVAVPLAAGTRILGKPADETEAEEMLGLLSSSRHAVITGVCVARADREDVIVGSETTWVTMRVIEPAEIAAYVASGEWRDKAGGYAIQENADRFVLSLEGGGFDNVVGLPVPLTRALLERAGAPPGELPSPPADANSR